MLILYSLCTILYLVQVNTYSFLHNTLQSELQVEQKLIYVIVSLKMQIQNCFKIKCDSSGETKAPLALKQNDTTPAPKQIDAPPAPKQNDVQPTQLQSPGDVIPYETVEEAAVAAAYKIAEAENKSFVAAEAVKESERVSQMFEDTNSVLQLAEEFLKKCNT